MHLNEERLDALERTLRTDLKEAKAKLAQLEEVLNRATQLVTRNSADVGAQVQTLEGRFASLEGQLAEDKNTIERLQSEVADQHTKLEGARKNPGEAVLSPTEVPADRAEHFAAAYRAYQAGDYTKSRALFREFLTRYPQDAQADNAQYWVGSSYMRENKPATALGEFRAILSQYPKGDVVDKTLLDMGDAFFRLHACSDARTALETLVRGHTRSPLARSAREKLREIQKAPRAQCTS